MKISLLDALGVLAIVGLLMAGLISVNAFEISSPGMFLFGPILIAGFSSPFETSGFAYFQNSICMFVFGLGLSFVLMLTLSAVLFRPSKLSLFISIISLVCWPIIGMLFLRLTEQVHR